MHKISNTLPGRPISSNLPEHLGSIVPTGEFYNVDSKLEYTAQARYQHLNQFKRDFDVIYDRSN